MTPYLAGWLACREAVARALCHLCRGGLYEYDAARGDHVLSRYDNGGFTASPCDASEIRALTPPRQDDAPDADQAAGIGHETHGATPAPARSCPKCCQFWRAGDATWPHGDCLDQWHLAPAAESQPERCPTCQGPREHMNEPCRSRTAPDLFHTWRGA